MRKDTWIVRAVIRAVVVIAFVAPLVHSPCRADNPDPTTLLQGVEAARLQVPASRLRLRASFREALIDNTYDLTVVFDGDRRRFDGNGSPARCLFDGSEVIHFDGTNSVTIRDPNDSTADYLFDPRLLGITTTYWWSESFTGVLPHADALKIETIGREPIGENSTWHVRVIDSYDQQIDVWIDESNDFRVYRYDFSIKDFKRNTSLSFFENDDYPWLPSRVETRYFRIDGETRQIAERHVSILEAAVDVVLPNETWTLAGLQLPIGATISDLRIKQRQGYWNGTGIQRDPPDTSIDGTPEFLHKEDSNDRLMFVVVNVGAIVGILIILLVWRNRTIGK